MLSKEKVISTISKFPEKFSLDQVIEKLIFLDKIEKGLEDSDNDRVISEEEVEEKMKEWLK